MLIPVIGFAPRFFRWLYVRPINRLHRALGNLERELDQSADRCRFVEYQTRVTEIESAVRLLKVARPFEAAGVHRLRRDHQFRSKGVTPVGLPGECPQAFADANLMQQRARLVEVEADARDPGLAGNYRPAKNTKDARLNQSPLGLLAETARHERL